jgi:glutamine cyclotransferase
MVFLASCQRVTVETLVPEVINRYPHDESAFTQGLLLHEGDFFESTGLTGRSSLREVLLTGEVQRRRDLDDELFGEGLARVGDQLIQLTWLHGRAFVYDLETFEELKVFSYETEGWGLCYDGEHLYMTDGSSTLFRRNSSTFELLEEIEVTLSGEPLRRLNELECVGGHVYANVFTTDTIVKIDKKTGKVVAEIDASNLLSAEESRNLDTNAVLNGIAFDPQKEVFYLTGKLWPALFEVRFVKR